MGHNLNFAWRLFGTGLAFFLFSAGGFFMSITLFPLVSIMTPDENKRKFRTQSLIHGSFRLFAGFLSLMGILNLHVEGVEKLLNCHGKIIVANHPSLLDVVLLMSLLSKGQCVVKHQLWDNWFLGGVVRAAGYIRNDEDPEKMIADCVEVLKQGENIVLFPEGTRTVPGKQLKFQRGFANIATFAEADLQVVTITCIPTSLTKGEPWYKIPETKMQYTIIAHDNINVKTYIKNDNRTVAVRKLTRYLEQYYAGKLSNG